VHLVQGADDETSRRRGRLYSLHLPEVHLPTHLEKEEAQLVPRPPVEGEDKVRVALLEKAPHPSPPQVGRRKVQVIGHS